MLITKSDVHKSGDHNPLKITGRNRNAGNPNWNPADGEDPYSWYSKSIEMYDKGVILWGFKEYEGESFELYIPIITTLS